MTDIRVPTLGESVTEATIGKWFKKAGDAVAVDEPLVELETDKVTIEVPAPAAGVLVGNRGQGRRDRRGRRAARPDQGWRGRAPARPPPRRPASPTRRPRPRRRSRPAATPVKERAQDKPEAATPKPAGDMPLAPSVRKMSAESGVDPSGVAGSGKDGRVTKGDMMAAIERAASQPTPAGQPVAAVQMRAPSPADDAAREERVKMTRLRQTIARRLKDAQNTAAMLTTFNEVDMTRGHGDAQSIQGIVREEARREARLHGLLRARLRAGAEGNSRGQCRDRRHRSHLQELLSHRRRGRHREGSGRAGGARLRHEIARRDRKEHRRFRQARARRRSSRSRRCRAAPSPSRMAASMAR